MGRSGFLRSLALGLAAVIGLGGLALAALELRLSGPFGMSGYILYRAARTAVRDMTVPTPAHLPGFANEGPNVVVIVLDCYRYDYLLGSSPRLAEFGEQGWWFDRYYSAAPWTKPSTTSLFTGLHVRKHFVMKGGGSQLPGGALTIAEIMKSRGYTTGGFVWNPHLTRRQAFDQGFDHYVDDAIKGSKALLYEVFDWLEKEKPERFFAYVHFQGTHDPYYDDNDIASLVSAPGYDGDLDLTNMDYKQDVKEGYRFTPEESAHLQHIAEGVAKKVDRQAVGGFLDRFYGSELPENTLVIFTSDHGDQFFEHGAVSHGASVYDEEIHVPLLVHFPPSFAEKRGFAQTGRETCPSSTVDILPTVLDFVGAPVPPGLDGVSIVPDRPRDCSRPVISEKTVPTGGIPAAALVAGDYKVIVDYESGSKEVFDLSSDPAETRNQATALSEQGEALEAELSRRLNADGSSMALWSEVDGELPEEQMEALRALGYLD